MKITWRRARLPGVDSKGAFFTRGSGHNKFGGYTETPDEYQEVMDRLLQKHQAAAEFVPASDHSDGAPARSFGVVTIGRLRSGGARGVGSSRRSAASTADYMRVRGFPFAKKCRSVSECSTSSVSWWNRIATRSFGRCLTLETSVAEGKAADPCWSTADFR